MSLIYTLILFFIFLLVYQIYLDIYSSNLIEGLETNIVTAQNGEDPLPLTSFAQGSMKTFAQFSI